jgi:uncharacterized protein YycO
MISNKPVRVVLSFAVIAGALLAFLHFLDRTDPEVDEPDDEDDREIDPDLPGIRPGDVLLFNRAKGLNRLITWFTKSPYYHVGISMGNNEVVEARPRGVVVRDLTGPDGDKRFEIIPREQFGEETSLRALEWAKTQIGDGYDPFNVLSIVLDRTFTCCAINASLPNHWACGEFVVTAFEEAGKPLFDKPTAAVVPADFAQFLL